MSSFTTEICVYVYLYVIKSEPKHWHILNWQLKSA